MHTIKSMKFAPRSKALLDALATRVVIADGAMGTELQERKPTLEDFQNLEGCNEILNVTRPDIVKSVHDAYFEAGIDCIESNTFGANWSNLSDYGIEDRIEELAEVGARIARQSADDFTQKDSRPRWVLGSMGPGTKLPSLGHVDYAFLRDTFKEQAVGLIKGGSDAFLVETSQDLLQTKAAINGCRLAILETGTRLPIFVEVTVETTGTMLMGSEIGAALTAIEPLGIDMIGLNCATGPTEMSEHLRQLSKHSRVPIMVMPNAGLPVLTANGASYPLGPEELAVAHEQFVKEFGLAMIGGCCGTTPAHLKAVVDRLGQSTTHTRTVEIEPGVASLYQHVPLTQDNTYLAIGERTNANGSRAFKEAMLDERWDDCIDIARKQVRDGAHLLDVSVDYVGRDGVADMRTLVSKLASASTLPLVIDSTEPAVIKAGLELIGGRPVVNSVNFEDGDGPTSRFAKIMPLVKEHGTAVIALTIDEQGQARNQADKVRIASD
jgi:5-methyltetrahydrofolate--homocysteine methyltransferase